MDWTKIFGRKDVGRNWIGRKDVGQKLIGRKDFGRKWIGRKVGLPHSDSFPFDLEQIWISFGSKSKEKMSPQSHSIEF